jgi:hypothetical protein
MERGQENPASQWPFLDPLLGNYPGLKLTAVMKKNGQKLTFMSAFPTLEQADHQLFGFYAIDFPAHSRQNPPNRT